MGKIICKTLGCLGPNAMCGRSKMGGGCAAEFGTCTLQQIEGARNSITQGQFELLKPEDPIRAAAVEEFFFGPDQSSGYDLDRKYQLVDPNSVRHYTARAAKNIERKVQRARELVES